MSGGEFSMDSIPPGVRKTILDIKEISRIHTEEEIYTMLQECSMDPNETVQKLLAQDPFHEVKRKRDRRKENVNSKEPVDSRWKQGMQRREVRGGRGAYLSRYISHDAAVARNINATKENGISQVAEKGIALSSSLGAHETEYDSGVVPQSSSVSGVTDGPTKSALVGSSQESGSHMLDGGGFPFGEESSITETKSAGAELPPVDSKSGPETAVGVMHGRPVQSSYQFPSPGTGMTASVSGVYASATDPLLVPSPDTCVPGVVGIKHEVASERNVVEPTVAKVASNTAAGSEISPSEKAASEMGGSSTQGKMLAKYQVIDVNNLSDAPQPSSSSQFSSSGNRSSSNYSSRSQQIIGPQKVGPSKEWKPKSTSQVPAQVSGAIGTSDAVLKVEVNIQSESGVYEEAASKLQKKMEEMHFSDDQHVIIPNHLQVPESERTGLSFGSFDASFGLGTRFMNGPRNENCSIPLTNSSQVSEENIENIEEPTLSTQNTSTVQEEDFPDDSRSSSQMPGNLSPGEADISSISAVSEYDQNKQEAAVAQEGPQFSVVHTTPTYSTFGLIPPMLGGQFAPFERSEPQARDAPPLPSFVVQQPFDPSTGYYTQIYPPGADGNGRFSPFLSPDTAAKYNGNVAIFSSQTAQTSQESANSIVLPTTGPTPVVTQAGVMQTSIPVTQQPVPVFRQPAGVHISHYPPNYIPYQYFSPLYVPSPSIQHFLSNAAFLQQPLAGSMYPPPAAPATTAIKNSLSQYKTGTNSSNSTHSGMPTSYGPYGTPTGYSPSPTMTSGNSTGNEDITGSQYKEHDVYITGQQSEGSAVWVPAPGRDNPSVQTSSLYNLPLQGQHMTFTPLQPGHGAFNGIYHPTQSVPAGNVHPLLQPSQTMGGAVDMVGRPSSVYQQPQRAQVNWGSNY